MFKWCLLTLGLFMAVKVNASFFEECDETFQSLVDMKLHKGLVAYIDDGTRSFIKAYGNLKESRNSFFEIGSLTKGITGILVLEAHKASKLDITKSLSNYIDDLRNEEVGKVTLIELLTHTSGIRTDKRNVMFKSDPYQDFNEKMLLNEVLDIEIGEKKFLYSNLGVALLGVVLSKIYLKPYEEIALEFLEGIGITKMSFDNKELIRGNTYYFNDSKSWNLNSINPAGGIKSDLDSLVKFSKFLKKYKSKDTLFSPLIENGTEVSFLWGIFDKRVFCSCRKNINA